MYIPKRRSPAGSDSFLSRLLPRPDGADEFLHRKLLAFGERLVVLAQLFLLQLFKGGRFLSGLHHGLALFLRLLLKLLELLLALLDLPLEGP